MEFKQLRYFVAIVEEGSLNSAANRVGITQPSLTQHIKSLEERLGCELLNRSSRGVTVTEAGQALLTHAREILSAVELAKEEVRLAGTDPFGKVSFGLPSSVSMVVSAPLAERVRAELPRVNLRAVEAMSGFIRDWLQDETLDLAILYDTSNLRHMQSRLLMTEDLYFFASPDAWPLKSLPGTPVSLAAVASLELVLPSRNHGLRATIERAARAHGIALDVVVEMDSLAQIKTLVSRGSAHTILAAASAKDALRAGQLLSSPVCEPRIQRPVYLVRNPARVSTRASREVESLTIRLVNELVMDGTWKASAT